MEKIPRIGVGTYIRKEGKLLLGKRMNAHGVGTWCPPGGHLEFMESIEDCARRETMEESGLEIINIQPPDITEDHYVEDGRHYVTMHVVADWKCGEPEVCEPHKCEGWEWFAWDELPQPLMLSMQRYVDAGFNPFNE